MSTMLVALGSLLALLVAYHTYGRWISKRVFGLDREAPVPSHGLRDNVDFVPSRRSVVFGHHFTSIAGTGPIVGPAIAVFWGWLPALIWVVFGSILVGGVHDMASLVISLRNRGQTLGEIAGRMITPRAKLLFLAILALALWIVLAIFGLVIANIFSLYPESVLPVWISMPAAMAIGVWAYKYNGSLLWPSIGCLLLAYGATYLGVYYFPISLASIFPATGSDGEATFWNPVVVWTMVLLLYCFFASVMPVWLLLQPRDFINNHQLQLALVLLVVGLVIAGLTGSANLFDSTEAISSSVPADAPPMLPFLFITIACGACSGFHCLVSSGTSSKQVDRETDAQLIGYGAMLMEGALAVVVILACTAGVGMGAMSRLPSTDSAVHYEMLKNDAGEPLVGRPAWEHYYRGSVEGGGGWAKHGMPSILAAFVEGGANFLTSIGLPVEIGIGIMAVLVASFAATTLDTATRLQRYVLQELGETLHVAPMQNKYVATAVAVGVSASISIFAGDRPGEGGKLLWPLFGATNQLLAGMAFLVAVFYLWRRSKPIAVVFVPMMAMMLMPAWAMTYNLIYDWIPNKNMLLIAFGSVILGLQAWMVIEAVLVYRKVRGVLEPQLSPMPNYTRSTVH